MKSVLIILAALFLSYTGNAQEADQSTLVKIGNPVPDFSFEIEKNKTSHISDYKGKLVLINLFATWCPPCRAELPQMQKKIWEKHKDNPRFALLVFGREEGWDTLNSFKKKFNYSFPILPDTARGVFGKFATQSIPRNFLIDENGKIIYQSIGFEPKEFQKLVHFIDEKLQP